MTTTRWEATLRFTNHAIDRMVEQRITAEAVGLVLARMYGAASRNHPGQIRREVGDMAVRRFPELRPWHGLVVMTDADPHDAREGGPVERVLTVFWASWVPWKGARAS